MEARALLSGASAAAMRAQAPSLGARALTRCSANSARPMAFRRGIHGEPFRPEDAQPHQHSWQHKQQQRRQHDSHARSVPLAIRVQPALLGMGLVLVGYQLYTSYRPPLLLESLTSMPPGPTNAQGMPITATLGGSALTQQEQMRQRARTQGLYLWGSNRYNVVAPDAPALTFVKSPRSVPYFDGMALRGLVLEEKHAAALDANGDLLQWGLGFFDASARTKKSAVSSGDIEEVPLGRRRDRIRANELTPLGQAAAQARAPARTLTGKDLVKVVAAENKVYALGRNGDVYVVSALQVLQQPGRKADWSWNPLKLFNLFAPRTVDYEKLRVGPASSGAAKALGLARGEKVVDIDAGLYHLIALTNKGRTLACPIDSRANDYGQLGVKRVWLNAPVARAGASGETAAAAAQAGKAGTKQIEALLEPRIFRLDDFYESESKVTLVNLLPDWALPPAIAEKGQGALQPQKLPSSFSTHPLARLPPDASAAAKRAAAEEAARREAALASQMTEPPSSIRYCTTLHEVPSLRGIVVDQISAGNEHTLARTAEGRVLAWGRHTHGQCGLGSQIAMESVPVPTEVVLSRCFSSSSMDVACIGIRAGADNSFFVSRRRDASSIGTRGAGEGYKIDVLAAGKGQWGTLGNAMWSQVAASPVRVKTVSGLMEYSEITNRTHPVDIYSLAIGRPGHVTLVLDTVDPGGHVAFGRDVMVWGHNAAFQLGNGKRANLSVPQHLKPLPPLTLKAGDLPADAMTADSPYVEEPVKNEKERQKLREADINSGALTHMPHNRLQLTSRSKVDTRSSLGRDKPDKRGVTVEEEITAGATASGVFWKIHE